MGLSKGRTLGILVASASAAVSTLGITIVAARALTRHGDATGYAEFMVFWAFLFGVYGIVVGLQNETTRAVGRARERTDFAGGGASVLGTALLLAGCTAAVVALTSPWWGPRLTPESMPGVVGLVVIGLLLYGPYQAWLGAASGRHDWSSFSWLMILDAVARLLLVVLAAVAAWGIMGLEAACVAAGASWLLLILPTRRGRAILGARADVPLPRYLRNCLLSMVSSTSTAILITAFPTLIQLTSRGTDAGVLAGTITAISLTRSPLLIPLQAFQGVAISAFLTKGTGLGKAIAKPAAAIIGVGLVLAAAAGLLGPWLLRLLYGPAIIATGWTFAGLTVAAIPLALVTLTGTATVAVNAHQWFSLGWFTSALISGLLLLLPLDLPVRVCIGLFVGPIIGVGIHLLGIARARRYLPMQAA